MTRSIVGAPRACSISWWVNGAGALVTEGRVTDDANGGDFQVTGGTTPPGETSPLLQAGGLVVLGATSLT